ncbi:hypothetical protein FACS1894105_13880 [Clostridia bacterium]|nr:hypothetical protein FACS1894105_13880 [Clostridia bacterium]
MADFSRAARHISTLEEYAGGGSVIHRLPVPVKIFTVLAYIVAVVAVPVTRPEISAAFSSFFLIILPLSETPFAPLFKRSLIALPFAAFGAVWNIFLSDDGVLTFTSVIIKTFLVCFAALTLIATTPFDKIIRSLECMHLPKILCVQIAMMYRYLPVLLGEAGTMYTAYRMRNRSAKKGVRLKDAGVFLGQLILRSFDRAERVYQAMKSRGF